MASVWQTLVGNFACVALIISTWMHFSYRLSHVTKGQQQAFLGAALGLAAVASMALAIRFEQGIYLDLRLSMVVVSAVFGGPISLVVTVIISSAFRLYLGGAGAHLGLIGILLTALAGLCLWRIVRRNAGISVGSLIFVASMAGALSVIVLKLLPPEIFERALNELGVQIALANFAATAAAGWAISYFRQFTLERDILHAALTQAPAFHYVKDLRSRFIVTNRNVARQHGREKTSEMVGLSDFDLEPAERARELFENEQAILRSGKPTIDLEECIDRGLDGKRWYITSKVPLRNRQGDLIGLAGVTVDISERKQLEAELLSSRNVMAHAMAEMSDGLALFDANGYLVFCNEQYRALFPRSAYARVPGAHIVDIIRAAARNAERSDLPADSSEETIRRAATLLHTPKDELIQLFNDSWVRVRTRPADDGSSLVVVSDVTLMKQSEESLRQLANQMKHLAATDGLTGLANRRMFDEALQIGIAASASSGSPLALLLIDVDRFKMFNDTYGHGAGDDCLQRVGREIRAAAKREGDLAARYGGEEFCILLAGASLENAIIVADNLRQSIRSLAIAHSGSDSGVVTVSIGVAVLGDQLAATSSLDLVATADCALYSAKRSGRDRTETASGALMHVAPKAVAN